MFTTPSMFASPIFVPAAVRYAPSKYAVPTVLVGLVTTRQTYTLLAFAGEVTTEPRLCQESTAFVEEGVWSSRIALPEQLGPFIHTAIAYARGRPGGSPSMRYSVPNP